MEIVSLVFCLVLNVPNSDRDLYFLRFNFRLVVPAQLQSGCFCNAGFACNGQDTSFLGPDSDQ